MLKKIAVIATTAVCILANSVPAFAVGPGGLARGYANNDRVEFLVARRSTLAPFAFVKFCRANPTDCSRSNGPEIAELTNERERQLHHVNRQVNQSIKAVNEVGPRDRWEAEVAQGDCEDFALTKRRKLVSLGWSPRALRIAVTRTASGEGHAVLVVKTSKGDLVLDNRMSAIKGFKRTDLSWLKIQSGENPRMWHSL